MCKLLVKVLILSFVNFGELILLIPFSFETDYEFDLEHGMSNASDQEAI